MEIKKKLNQSRSIFSSLGDNEVLENKNSVKIDIDCIDFNPKNFYGESDTQEDIQELAESIKEIGLMHNILVIPSGNGRYVIITGEKRTKAFKYLYETEKDDKWKYIPASIRDDMKNDSDVEIALIKANRDVRERSETVKAKEVEILEKLYEVKKASGEKVGIVRKKIAEDLGMSERQIQRYKKVNELIPEFREMLDNGDLALTASEHFASFEPEIQKSIYDSLIQKGKKISREEAKEIRDETQSLIDSLKTSNEKLQKQIEESNNEKIKYKEKLQSIVSEKESLNNKMKELEDSKDNKSNEEIKKINEELKNLKKQYVKVESEKNKLREKLEQNEQSNNELKSNLKEKIKTESKVPKKDELKEGKNTENKALENKELIEDIKLNVDIKLYIKNTYEAVKSLSDKVNELLNKNIKISEENGKVIGEIKEIIEIIDLTLE